MSSSQLSRLMGGCPSPMELPKEMSHGWSCRGDLSQPEVKRDVAS